MLKPLSVCYDESVVVIEKLQDLPPTAKAFINMRDVLGQRGVKWTSYCRVQSKKYAQGRAAVKGKQGDDLQIKPGMFAHIGKVVSGLQATGNYRGQPVIIETKVGVSKASSGYLYQFGEMEPATCISSEQTIKRILNKIDNFEGEQSGPDKEAKKEMSLGARARRQAKRNATTQRKNDELLRRTGFPEATYQRKDPKDYRMESKHPQDFHKLAAELCAPKGVNEDDAADNETGGSAVDQGVDPADNWFGEVFKEKLDPKQYERFVKLMTRHDNLIDSMSSKVVDGWFESGGPLHVFTDFIRSEQDLQNRLNEPWEYTEGSGEYEEDQEEGSDDLTPKEKRLAKIVDQVLEIIGPLGSEE